jgi:hypothetical protein
MRPIIVPLLLAAVTGGVLSAPGPNRTPDRRGTPSHAPVRLAALEEDTSCKIEFAGPGQQCGSYGTCPDTAQRSFFWGLIEYETEVVLCFCLTECDIDITFWK